MSALASSPHLADENMPAFYAQAKEVQKRAKLANIALSDASAQQLLNLRVNYGAPLPAHGSADLGHAVAQTGEPRVSDLFKGNVSGNFIVNVGVPVTRGSQPPWVLTGALSPQRLSDLLTQQQLPAEWILTILDGRGVVVARSRDEERFVGQQGPQALAERVRARREGAVETTSLEGTPVLHLLATSKNTGWAFSIGIPQAELTGALWRRLWEGATLAALFLTIGIGFAWTIGRRIANSVRSLEAPALALGRGVSVPVQRPYFKEVQQLEEAIAEAAGLIRDAGERIAQGEERLRNILESASDAIISFDSSQRVVYMNSAACRILGWDWEEAVGGDVSQFLPQRHRHSHLNLLSRFLNGKSQSTRIGGTGEVVAMRRDGSEFPIEGAISRSASGKKALCTIILRDITEDLAARRDLLRSNENLRQFAFVASHDLKGPLRSIAGFVGILQRTCVDRLDSRALDLLDRTGNAAKKLERLTEGLLSLAQLDGATPALVPVDMQAVMADVSTLLQHSLELADASIVTEQLPTVMGSREQLTQVMLNLVSNAIKFRSSRPPIIRVWGSSSAMGAQISISDNGVGIPPEQQSRVFDVFTRLQREDTHEGTGIGLALCRKIVEGLGGRICVESSSDAGTTITMQLKRHPRAGEP